MLSVEFLFGMLLGWIAINCIGTLLQQADENGAAGVVIGIVVSIVFVGLSIGAGFLGVWLL